MLGQGTMTDADHAQKSGDAMEVVMAAQMAGQAGGAPAEDETTGTNAEPVEMDGAYDMVPNGARAEAGPTGAETAEPALIMLRAGAMRRLGSGQAAGLRGRRRQLAVPRRWTSIRRRQEARGAAALNPPAMQRAWLLTAGNHKAFPCES